MEELMKRVKLFGFNLKLKMETFVAMRHYIDMIIRHD